ncbi:putative Methionyl-tRNA formyltransferase [Bradyrhizobium sp. ORS 375]|uniref:methionyl-tRNA formyltransferase n=1 Tax=Bradyrhizobium sp. (strain ORS 375) TaxID=566679 RepID=UPI00024096B4|nr:formyltransferase family protein [Bradyrhizobium sp. ORS 375]CCD97010.1 putative Methionyl-tRNA formyltransferase [Bradyrhizobium sp. ORS 375]
MERVRIAILGSSVPSFELADALIAAGCDVCAIVPPRGTLGGGVQRRAAARGLLVVDVGPSINDPATIAKLRALDAELFVNWGHPERFAADVLALPRLGVLNLHPGEIPGARGLEPVFAAILEGWPAVIQTAHLMSAAFDDGPIIRTRRIAIDDAPYRDVVEERLRDGAVGFYQSAVLDVLAGERGTPGAGPRRYFGKLKPDDDVLRWHEPREAVLRRLRALSPFNPGRSFVAGHSGPLLIWRAEASDAAAKAPAGRVIAAGDDELLVAAADGLVRITAYQLPPALPSEKLIGAELTSDQPR